MIEPIPDPSEFIQEVFAHLLRPKMQVEKMGLITCPHQAVLVFPENGEIVGVPIDMDRPELLAVKEILQRASQHRRPPERLVREINHRMDSLGKYLERRMNKERASFN